MKTTIHLSAIVGAILAARAGMPGKKVPFNGSKRLNYLSVKLLLKNIWKMDAQDHPLFPEPMTKHLQFFF